MLLHHDSAYDSHVDLIHTYAVPDEDTIPPVVNGCPDSINMVIPFGLTTVNVTWIEPIATDNSGMIPTVNQSHQPGDSFPVGTTQVSYIFTDLAGNEVTCSFTVGIGKLILIRMFLHVWVLLDMAL